MFTDHHLASDMRRVHLLESGDMRCIDWQWNKDKAHNLVTDLARKYCVVGAAAGSLPMIRRYARYVEPASVANLHHTVFAGFCDFGYETQAIELLFNPPWIDLDFASSDLHWLKMLFLMAPHVAKVPKVFEFLLKSAKDMNQYDIYLACLLASCSSKGYALDGFDWFWNHKPTETHNKRWWIEAFFDRVHQLLDRDEVDDEVTHLLSRLPAITKRYFLEESESRPIENDGHLLALQNCAMFLAKPDENNEVSVILHMKHHTTVFSMLFRIPFLCTQ